MDSLITWKMILPFEMGLPNNILFPLSIKVYIENQKKNPMCKTSLEPSRNVTVSYWGSSLNGVNEPGFTELQKS